MDTKGVHCLSCMGGGDAGLRHNEVRDILYIFAERGRLRPALEKVGLLDEPGVYVDLRRPADVLVNGLTRSAANDAAPGVDGRSQRVALEVKVINALGADHFDRCLESSQAPLSAYRQNRLEHMDTAALCAARGIRYEPLVFSAQGGCESHAEGVLHQLAHAVADAEGINAAAAKADLMGRLAFP